MSWLLHLGQRSQHVALFITGIIALLTAGWTAAAAARQLAQPRIGGTITTRLTFVPDCLDPAKTTIDTAIFSDVLDSLVSEDDTHRLQPDLATKWRISDSGKHITFFLRHGVKFSNGDPFTAADVKFTFERALRAPAAKAQFGTLQRVKVINPSTAELILSAPYRPLLSNISSGYGGILDPKVVKKLGNNTCTDPVGTGPFKIKSVGPAFNPVVLVRNPLHTWNPPWVKNQGRAYISQVIFKPIVSDSTAVSELLTGGVDISQISADQLPRVKNNRAITLRKLYLPHEEYLGFNTAHAPFNTVAVRRAIAEAIDRQAVVKAAVGPFGIPAYSALPDTMPDYDQSAKSYAVPYNLAAAKQVLQANHVTGPYTLVTYDIPANRTAAELIQGELQQVGVRTSIVVKSFADAGSVLSKGQYDLLLGEYGYFDPDILYLFFHSSQEVNGGLNYTFYKSATLDKLLVEGRTTYNATKVKAIYAQVQRLLDAKVITDPLWTDRFYWAVRTRIKGAWHPGEYEIPYQDLWVQ